jgi:ATP-binding cassette, subfamily B, bacterial PglK
MRGVLHELWFVVGGRERRVPLGMLVLSALGAILETLGVGAIPAFVMMLSEPDAIMRSQMARHLASVLGANTVEARILWAALALAVLFTMKNALLVALSAFHVRDAQQRQLDLSARLLRAYLHAPYTFHLQRNTAELLHRTRGAAQRIVTDVLLASRRIVMEALVVVTVLGVLVAVQPAVLIGMGVLLAGVSVAFFHGVRRSVARFGQDEEQAGRAMIQSINQGLGSIKELKLLGREDYFLDKFIENAQRHGRSTRYRSVVAEFPRPFFETVAVIAMVGVVAYYLAGGTPVQATIPVLALLAVATVRLIPSANRILNAVLAIQWARPALHGVFQDVLLLEPVTSPEPSLAPARPTFRSSIELAGVSFRYPAAPADALDGVSLHIARGSCTGIVGPSGSGKTTLVDVLLGLLAPTAGQVLVDGHDVQEDLAAWQRQIGYIPQVAYLADDTLRRNVAFGLPDDEIDEERVWRALAAAQLQLLVCGLPDRLDTLLGERGVRFSGGERQRIAIARALYHDPAVLVLDEPTSALDEPTELRVMEVVVQLRGARTVIVVSHRHSTIAACDTVCTLCDGRLVATSTRVPGAVHDHAVSPVQRPEFGSGRLLL